MSNSTCFFVPAARFLRPGFSFFASLTPIEGVAERRESSGACEAPVGPARNAAGQAPSEAPCLPYGGRSPPGALTVAILGSGPALPSPAAPLGLRFGEHRIGHSELLASGSSPAMTGLWFDMNAS